MDETVHKFDQRDGSVILDTRETYTCFADKTEPICSSSGVVNKSEIRYGEYQGQPNQ